MLPATYRCSTYTAKVPLFSNEFFDARQLYNIHNIANDKFEIDMPTRAADPPLFLRRHGSAATIAATLSHATFFYGKYVLVTKSPTFYLPWSQLMHQSVLPA
ncbi:hypothetical protein ZWY2020_005502 [Hordeum vulgare]|nr:hypothetical protein ZWY2020_005502 [Hordeum vulgare]